MSSKRIFDGVVEGLMDEVKKINEDRDKKLKEGAEGSKKLSFEEAMNNSDFLVFLTEKGGIEVSKDNEEEIKAEYEIFKAKTEVGPLLRKIYDEALKSEVDIELSDEDFKDITEMLDVMAKDKDREEEVMGIWEGAKEYFDLPKRIKQKEAEIAKIEAEQKKYSDRDFMLKQHMSVEKMGFAKKIPLIGWLTRSKEEDKLWERRYVTRRALFFHEKEEMRIKPEKIEQEYEKAIKRGDKIEDAKMAIAEIERLRVLMRQEILSGLDSSRVIVDRVKDKLRTRVHELTKSNKLEDWIKLYEEIDRIDKAPEELTFDYIEEEDAAEVKEVVDAKIGIVFRDELLAAIEGFAPKDSPLNELKLALKDYLEKKKLGSLDEEGIKTLVKDILIKKIADLDSAGGAGDKSKRILLQCILKSY